MISGNGIITGLSLTAVNGDEREALWDLKNSNIIYLSLSLFQKS